MNTKMKPAVISVVMFLLVFANSMAMGGDKRPQDNGLSGKSCPHEEVKEVPGSKIRFLEDAFDFGQIPTDRKVTHNFLFENIGTAPLLIAQHIKSKPIEGC